MKRLCLHLLVLPLLTLGLACGDDDDDDDAPDAAVAIDAAATIDAEPAIDADLSPDAAPLTCDDDQVLCASIEVPEGFTGTPTGLFTALYARLPPMGPPDVFGIMMDDPPIADGTPLPILHPEVPAEGSYFYYVILYMPGGGTTQPVAGVDYVAQTEEAVAFDGSPIDLGTLTLELYNPGG